MKKENQTFSQTRLKVMKYLIEIEGKDQEGTYVMCTFPAIQLVNDRSHALAMELPQAMKVGQRLKERGISHHMRVRREMPLTHGQRVIDTEIKL